MSALSTRDALIRTMASTRITIDCGDLIAGPELGEWIEFLADALIASGAVIDTSALAEPFGDVAHEVARGVEGQAASLPATGPPVTVERCYAEGIAQAALRALAAALTERAR